MKSLEHKTLLISLLVLALTSTVAALFFFQKYTCHATVCAGPTGSLIPYASLYSVSASIAVVFWLVFGFAAAIFWRSQYNRDIWRNAGFDKNVYDLMVKMRGGNSRLQLLRNLESPKQRNELSQVTGIDWKEVDRQVNLLQSYGLVSVLAETGSVKIYGLTEQGQLLLKLLGELNQ
ncbi:MAG: hypothetical protein JRN52_08385 [Nitrososphaerota archaeon]|nr:hypothetical protein [Nitrososphaerota archaeon]